MHPDDTCPTARAAPHDPHAAQADHLRAWDLLPWVVNGRATPEQARWVDEHVAGCEDCRAELAWQRSLRDAIAESPDIPAPLPVPAGDAEAGLQRLLARLDVPAEEQPAPARPAAGSRYLTQALAAAVVAQAVGLGLLSLHLWPGAAGRDTAGSGYQTLSEPAAAAGTLRVLPDGGMTQAEWRALLQAHGLQVVAGPNAAGAYALAPAPGASALPRATALDRLRANPGIRLAEPIGNAP